MRLLLASSSSGSRGGGEIFLRGLGGALARRGHEVLVWCSDHPRMDELAGDMATFARVVRHRYRNTYDRKLRSLSAVRDEATARAVATSWQELAPEVILINKQNLEDGLDLLRAGKLCGRPSFGVVHLTQSAAELKAVGAGLRDRVARAALRDFPGPLVAIEAARGEALRVFVGAHKDAGNRVRVIANGVMDHAGTAAERAEARQRLRDARGWPAEARVVLALGRLEPQKRPDYWLQLVAQVRNELPQHRFLWVGEGREAALFDEQWAAKGLQDVAARQGWAREVSPLLRGSDALLHTAAYEGLPLAILEAMGAGLPVLVPQDLATQMPSLTDGSVAVFRDAPQMAELLRNREQLETTVKRARRRFEQEFSIEVCARQYETLCRGLLDQRES